MNVESNPKIVFDGIWSKISIRDVFNKTCINVEKLYLGNANKDKKKNAMSYYNTILEKNNNKTLSFVKTILLQEDINKMILKGNNLILYFNNNSFINQKMVISFNCKDLKEHKYEIISLALKNYYYSLDKFNEKNKTNMEHIFIHSANKEYKKNNNKIIYNITDEIDVDYMLIRIDNILNNTDKEIYYSYEKNTLKDFDISNIVIKNNDISILIDGLNNITAQIILDKIIKHNDKLKKYKVIKLGGLNNGKVNNG